MTIKDDIFTAIANRAITRDGIALMYAHAIKEIPLDNESEFAEINRAIMNRWSRSALNYIKQQAWKEVNRVFEVGQCHVCK